MRLHQGALAIAAMTMTTIALGFATVGCNNGSNGNNANNGTPANNAAPAPATGDTSGEADTVDETAPAASAPPAPETENPGTPPSPNQTWIPGSWRFASGKYVWGKGHWEANRPGFSYHPARWVENNGKWEHHVGHWNNDKPGVGHPAHTDAPAPAHPAPAGHEPGHEPGRPETHH